MRMQASNASEAAPKKPRHLEARCDDSPEVDFTAAADAKQPHWLPQSEDPPCSPDLHPRGPHGRVTLPSQPTVAAAAAA